MSKLTKSTRTYAGLVYNQRKLRYARLVDTLLNSTVKPFIDNAPRLSLPRPKKILIVQSHLVGDLITITPMLRALRKAYPDSRISLLANEFAADLLEGTEWVDAIIKMKFPWSAYDYGIRNLVNIMGTVRKLRKEKFDISIDAQIDMRNALLMFLIGARRRLGYDITGGRAFLTDVPHFPESLCTLSEARLSLLNHLGIDTTNTTPEIPIRGDSIRWAERYLKANNLRSERTVGIHPAASKREKLWHPEKFAQVIDFCNQNALQPVVIEGPDDEDIADAVITRCKTRPPRVKTSLKNVAAFISRCSLVICLDSAAVYIAAAVGTPAITIYGPQQPQVTRPPGETTHVIWDDSFDCRPCEYGNCKRPHQNCMDAIAADTVIQKITEVLLHKAGTK